ncbi:ABC transporter substrate-binding protein [Oceanirhabdus sp. W0125-5]|uniref:ABC transporter substrate-binding protein n=1 Tax=Oceanirhabdus sp. W0125-5 TaxID=2999116 RepID=UPI0022F2A7B4|nr:ABC transporter substrate-binding protein [Oceanirhabdus sp. W0125-5]WBW98926.1 ABC transporter substrate-binding protein [Oceanirhabdus sp. W0125-5]
MKRVKCGIVIALLSLLLIGCNKENYENEKIDLTIALQVSDVYGNDVRTKLVENFNKKYDFYNITIKEDINREQLVKEINKGDIDIIFCSANTMREFEKEGLLTNLNNIYYRTNLFDKTYSAINSYGRIQNLFYGLPMYASTFEIFYDADLLKQYNIDAENDNILSLLKKCKDNNVKIPIFDGNENVHNFLLSMLMSNYVYLNNFDTHKHEMINGFVKFKELYDEGILSGDMFRPAKRKDLNDLIEGKAPLIISNSSDISEFKNKNISVWDNYKIEDYWISPPTFVDTIICFPAISKNEKVQKEFMRYFTGNEFHKIMEQEGKISADKSINKDLGGLNYYITKHLEMASQNDFIYNRFLISSMEKDLVELLEKTMNGKIEKEEMTKELNKILYEKDY